MLFGTILRREKKTYKLAEELVYLTLIQKNLFAHKLLHDLELAHRFFMGP